MGCETFFIFDTLGVNARPWFFMSASNNEVAVISTTQGELVVEFWSETAPKTVENFKKLANDAFYDGTCFHRIVKGFMIQGGDPLTKDPSEEFRWGTGDPGYKIEAEFSDRPHNKGVLSMARSSFGELIKGEEVLDTLGAVPCGGGGENSRPEERQGVLSITIVSRADAGVE